MNTDELKKILDEHKVYVESFSESGSKANLIGADLREANLRSANLRDANLRRACLIDADLREANLIGADLREANLRSANLREANLIGADLIGAYLRRADLRDADLRDADLIDADLRDANLIGADLRDANLIRADLRDANLRRADLRGANLRDAELPDHTYVIMGEKYPITITNGEYLRAGCQNHTIEDWRKFTKREIAEMEHKKALKFYPRLLDIADFYLGKGERPEWLNAPDSEVDCSPS